ncbi:MAG: ABC transporter ATP-binding protein [Campylobacterota bacterium]|nr:ABC transporter ATP-binding protein [Campylobacterota bacterium]
MSSKTKHPLLKVVDVSHNFDYPLFNDINLTLDKKETIAIIGSSGSGKSTLLNIFSSLLIPNSGKLYYNNIDILKQNKKELLKIRRDDFGIIFQSHYLFRGFNSIENLHITELLNDVKIDKTLLKKLNIEHIMKQGIGEISGGQQQRLSCARVLTKRPKIIFADEPTGNLDTKTALEVVNILFDYIKEHNAGMIIVTHDESLAYKCDKVYKLKEYKLEQLK